MDKKLALQLVRNRTKKTMVSALGIEITDFEEFYICGKMPVDHRTKQPFGLLHGGASVAFAETLGSIAAGNQVNLEKYSVVGIEINASHLRAVTGGWVHGKATPTRIGRTRPALAASQAVFRVAGPMARTKANDFGVGDVARANISGGHAIVVVARKLLGLALPVSLLIVIIFLS